MQHLNALIRGIASGILVLLAVACGAAQIGTTARAAQICEASGGAHSAVVEYGGRERSFRYFVPELALAEKPLPLVVALHGGFGTGGILAEQTGLDAAASRHGFAVVYPDGLFRSWNAGSCCGPPAKNNVDDVGFIRELVRDVRAASCIDGSRIYATGFSNGAMLIHRIACEAPELFTAIAPVSGGPMIDSCRTDKPMPALLLVGREDERIPWDGGTFKQTRRPSIAEQVETLARRNRCGEQATELPGLGGYCSAQTSCEKGAVRWCIIDGIGHQWPGGKAFFKRLLGPNSDVIDATDLVLRFFREYR